MAQGTVMLDEEDGAPGEKSKSQLKRESTALQDLGEELVLLPLSQFRRFDLPDFLYEAIASARDMTQRGARKRQLQLVGKLMREVDAEPIRRTLELVKNPGRLATAQLHKTEHWRDRLISEGDVALQALLADYPDADRTRLRQLARQAAGEQTAGSAPRSARLLFEYLRDLLKTELP